MAFFMLLGLVTSIFRKMKLKKKIILPLLLLSLLFSSCGQDELLIPKGEPIQLNSLLGDNEWSGSKVVAVNDSLRLRMHQDELNIYIAVDYDKVNLDQYRWVELYIYDSAKYFRFHASGQLGEQYLKPPYWTENWDWGNNAEWTATTQRLAGAERKSSSNEAYEFKFQKSKFKSRTLRLLFHGWTIDTQADFSANPFRYYFPPDADRYKSEGWLEFRY